MQYYRSRDGASIAYWVRGRGEPLVLVHGSGSDHTWWDGVAPLLAEKYTVYTPDRRGRGGSGDGPVYALEREFEDAAALIDVIGRPTNLLGHSFGGLCALEAARLTAGLRRLIVYEPPIPTGSAPLFGPALVERMRFLLQKNDPEGALLVYLADISAVPPDEIANLRRAPDWVGKVALAGTILREVESLNQAYHFIPQRFDRMTAPTLLMMGGESLPRRRQAIARLSAGLANARVCVLAGQGHVAMNTAPELFVQEVTKFLAG